MADPMTAERLAKAVEQRPDRYRTHWEGCETDVKHGDCAIRFLLGQLSAAQQEIAALRAVIEDVADNLQVSPVSLGADHLAWKIEMAVALARVALAARTHGET